MNVPADNLPMMAVPTTAQAAWAVQDISRIYARTLSGWAVDVLSLRRSGVADPVWNATCDTRRWSKAA